LPDSGVFPVGASSVRGVKEGVVVNHITAHVVSPFEDLGSDVSEEGVGGPSSKDHDLVDGMVMQKEGHGSTGAKGVSPDVRVVESEGFLVSEVSAGRPDEVEEEFAGDRHSLSSDMECIESCLVAAIGDAPADSGDEGVRLADRTEDGVAGALLSTNIHFLTILLVHESDCHVLCFSDCAVGGEDSFSLVSKNHMADIDLLRSSGVPGGAVFTGSHCIEECNYCEGSCDGRCCVASNAGAGTTDLEEDPEEFWSDGLLAFGWRVTVLKGL
jgi:hypothetical protein